jgi:hypothetical protein
MSAPYGPQQSHNPHYRHTMEPRFRNRRFVGWIALVLVCIGLAVLASMGLSSWSQTVNEANSGTAQAPPASNCLAGSPSTEQQELEQCITHGAIQYARIKQACGIRTSQEAVKLCQTFGPMLEAWTIEVRAYLDRYDQSRWQASRMLKLCDMAGRLVTDVRAHSLLVDMRQYSASLGIPLMQPPSDQNCSRSTS